MTLLTTSLFLLMLAVSHVTPEHQTAYLTAKSRVATSLARLKDHTRKPTPEDAEEYRAARQALRDAMDARNADCAGLTPDADGTCK